MHEEDKTKQELIQELRESRNYIKELESQLQEMKSSLPSLELNSSPKGKGCLRQPLLENNQQDLLRILIDSLPDLVSIKDKNGQYVIANIALAKHLGVKAPEELIGKTDFDFFPEDIAETYYQDEQAILQTERASINKEDVQHHNPPQYLLSTKIPLKNESEHIIGIISILQDITKRKQAEHILEAKERYLRTLTDSLVDAVFTVKMPERNIEFVNSVVENIFGYSSEEIIGEQTRIFYPSEESFLHFGEKLRDTLTQGQSQLITEHILRRKSGENFWASIATSFLYSEGELSQVISIVRDIGEHKKLEYALQESKQYLSNILEFSINAIIVINDEQKIITYNKGAEQIFGYSPEEVVGQTLDILLPTRYQDKHRFYIEKFSDSSSHARRMNERGQISGKRKDGSEFSAEASISKFIQGGKQFYTVMLQDISEKQLLQAEANIYYAAIEASSEMIVVVDKDYKYVVANQVYLDYHGLSRDNMIGRTMPNILGDTFFQNIIKEYFDKCLEGEVQNFEAQFNFVNVGKRDVLTNYSPLVTKTGNIEGVVVVIRDITDLKRAEEEAFAYRIEQEKVSILANFIQDASHEFRTPLSVIQSSLYLMNKIDDRDRKQEKAKQIEEQIKHMTQLVNMLVKMSKIDMDNQIDWIEVNINELLQRIIREQSTDTTILEKELIIKADLQEIPIILGNLESLTEAIKQILNNAIRFTEQNGQITIRSTHVDDSIEIEISDTGIGILEKDMPHLFKRFYRGDKAHTTRGFGLGLPIAKAIIEQHHGEIRVHSTGIRGEGTQVTITLPSA